MRILLSIVLGSLLLTSACQGSSRKKIPECDLPKVGKVLTACNGADAVVISLGSSDGVRPGDTFAITRGGKAVAEIVIHSANDSQAAGTAVGGAVNGAIRPGDNVIEN